MIFQSGLLTSNTLQLKYQKIFTITHKINTSGKESAFILKKEKRNALTKNSSVSSGLASFTPRERVIMSSPKINLECLQIVY